jgi:DNA-directed RNA polymerase subunit K/omega
MLYGRRLDQSLSHVDGSRYALVHAVSKRARQITLWLTADPAELRAESAPPPAPGELVTRDPVALAEAEILEGEVRVRWDPEGLGEDDDGTEGVETDPLLIETLEDEDGDGDAEEITPALAQVLGDEEATADAAEGDAPAADASPEEAAVTPAADDGAALAITGDDDLEAVAIDDEDEDLDDDGDDEEG